MEIQITNISAIHRIAEEQIYIKRGTEGPQHDPYSYEEITIKLSSNFRATAHIGFDNYIEIQDGDTEYTIREFDYKAFASIFEIVVGVTPELAHTIKETAQEARLSKNAEHGAPYEESGYPGETFLVCPCGEHLDFHFNFSAIE